MPKRQREARDDESGLPQKRLERLEPLEEGRRLKQAQRSQDKSVRRKRQDVDFFTIDAKKFRERVRFRDAAGFQYGVPRFGDALYRNYARSGRVDAMPDGTRDDEEVALSSKSMLLYLKFPRTATLQHLPRGHVALIDLKTRYNYVGEIDVAMVRRNEKKGHVVVKNLTRTER